jgi:hypothetical protein
MQNSPAMSAVFRHARHATPLHGRVKQNARSVKHLSLVIRSVLVLDLLGHRLDLVDGVTDTDQVAPCDTVERVACRADFAVDYVVSICGAYPRVESP